MKGSYSRTWDPHELLELDSYRALQGLRAREPRRAHAAVAGRGNGAAAMWGLMAVAALLGALSLAAWQLCLSPQPCKTRCASRRGRAVPGKAPRPASPQPAPRDNSPDAWPAVRYTAPRVGAGANTLLARRAMERGAPAAQHVPRSAALGAPPRAELRVSTDPRAAEAPSGPVPTGLRAPGGLSPRGESQQLRTSAVSPHVHRAVPCRRPAFGLCCRACGRAVLSAAR